eukprot:Opistho-2@2167
MLASRVRSVTLQKMSSAIVLGRSMSSVPAARRLDGRVAVVTASTEGIGYAIARRLGQEGAKVVISSRKKDNVDKVVQTLKDEGLSVTGIVCHVGKAEDRKSLIAKTVAAHGGIDILVSNAAVNPIFGSMLETTEDAWDKIFDINIKSAFFLAKEAMPHMGTGGRKGGSVVFVSSIAGFAPFEALGAYSVSKTALFGLTKALSREVGARNIRVNCIAPGIIKTKFSEALWTNKAILEKTLEDVPLNRLGSAEDCAGTVSFLASDDAAYVTGETIVTAGGMQSRL